MLSHSGSELRVEPVLRRLGRVDLPTLIQLDAHSCQHCKVLHFLRNPGRTRILANQNARVADREHSGARKEESALALFL